MVKNKLNIVTFSAVLAVASIFLWTGCSDDFLVEKKDYNRFSPEIYNDYTGAKQRVQDIYFRLLPNANSGVSYRTPGDGRSDVQTRATEEYPDFSFYVDPERSVTAVPGEDWFHVSGDKATSKTPWGEIRNCNDVIEGISGGTLPEEQKRELLGQVYFLRAWQYYLLVQTYGGVPIVDKVQVADVSQVDDLQVPRSTTKQCIDFICAEMQRAASMLPGSWPGEYGRITRGAALAVAARARLLYASPLFNRGDNHDRWQLAYDAAKAARDTLTMDGFGLYTADGPNGAGFAKMFSEYNPNEGVFVTMHNMVHDDDDAYEIWRNNTREQGLRPYNAGGSGTDVTQNMVDLFPMADGEKPGLSALPYSPLKFFKDRDPRFYRTFGFPGVRWRQEHGDPSSLSDMSPARFAYPTGSDHVLWNYCWYSSADRRSNPNNSGYGADLLGTNYKGVFLRKRCQDFDIPVPNASLVRWPASMAEQRSGNNLFREGAFPHMEIRYAEVLLNYAEAACGIGQIQEAIDVLKEIRARAGYDAAIAGANYGITASTRAEVFAAILYERQIEFAYEGKRFNDMRRWLLWDGGATQPEGASPSWAPTGWGGNTCTYLGVEPFNGKRRDRIEFHAKTDSPESAGETNDPLKALRPAPLDLKLAFSDQTPVLNDLEAFYDTNLERKVKIGDKAGLTVNFLPKMYFLGLTDGAQTNNMYLEQTIGWQDKQKGGANGTFDPLKE